MATKRCWSPLGRSVDTGRQPLNLGPGCIGVGRFTHRVGIAVHEIGHALGLIHEQGRTNRDEFVEIHWENIADGYVFPFLISLQQDNQIGAAVPYDLASVMQYAPWSFRKPGAGFTVTAKDELYKLNLGQGYRPTFFDAKAVNLAYCTDVCHTPLPYSCERGGYQDPNNCGACKCLEGWTGYRCLDVDSGSFGQNPGCDKAGTIWLTGYQDECIDVELPHFDDSIQECNWLVKLQSRPQTDTIDFWLNSLELFESPFTCFDFVEVKFNNDLKSRGPRFCTRELEDGVDGGKGHFVTSETNEISVNFVSFVPSYSPKFQMCFRMTPRCSMIGINGNGVINPTHLTSSTPSPVVDTKAVMAQIGADNDPCKTKLVVRTDTKGDVVWAAVSLGMHPNEQKYPQKYNKNYAFNLQGQKGVWERGAKLKDPVEIKSSAFPVSWSDGSINATIVEIIPHQEWRLQVTCDTKKVLDFEFGKKGNGNVEVSFGKQTGWNGGCF